MLKRIKCWIAGHIDRRATLMNGSGKGRKYKQLELRYCLRCKRSKVRDYESE